MRTYYIYSYSTPFSGIRQFWDSKKRSLESLLSHVHLSTSHHIYTLTLIYCCIFMPVCDIFYSLTLMHLSWIDLCLLFSHLFYVSFSLSIAPVCVDFHDTVAKVMQLRRSQYNNSNNDIVSGGLVTFSTFLINAWILCTCIMCKSKCSLFS